MLCMILNGLSLLVLVEVFIDIVVQINRVSVIIFVPCDCDLLKNSVDLL